MRSVAIAFGVSVGTVAYWVEHARGQRLDRVNFDDRKPGRAWNRIRMDVEARILSVRRTLREDSVLGEYGPDAIGLALQEDSSLEQLPSRTTIYRVSSATARSMARIGNAVRRRRKAGICPLSPRARPSWTALTSSRT